MGIVVSLASACTDTTAPGRFAGTYALERYEGQPLPAVSFQSPTGTVFVVREQLILGDGGTGIMTMTTRVVDVVTPQGSETTFSQALGYVRLGDGIAITFVCPPNADCIAGPHLVGERVGNGLSLSPPASSKPASIYSRVR